MRGLSLNTSFLIIASMWEDDISDYPLQYSFGYNAPGATVATSIRDASEVNFVSSILAQGAQASNYSLIIELSVADIFGCGVMRELTIRVYPQLGANDSAIIGSLLASAQLQEDATLVAQIISAGAGTVFSTDCSAAPNCSILNRSSCSYLNNTCGQCLSGYVGISGDANSNCLISSATNVDNSNCLQNTECISGSCILQRCVDVSKSCPLNCSGHGNCLSYDAMRLPLQFCSYSNSSCSAACTCESNYFGNSCSLSQIEADTRYRALALMCQSLYWTVQHQSIEGDVVTTRAQQVTALLRDAMEVDHSTWTNCSWAIIESIAMAPALAADPSAAPTVIEGLSSFLSRGLVVPLSILVSFYAALANMTAIISSNEVIGQPPVTLISENLRVHCFKTNLNSTANLTFFSPQTLLERVLGQPKTSLSLSTTSYYGSEVDISLIEISSNPANYSLLSAELVLQLTSTNAALDRRRLTAGNNEFTVTLTTVDFRVTSASNASAVNSTVICDGRRTAYNISVICSDAIYFIPCAAKSRTTYNYSCPLVTTVPVCVSRDVTSGFMKDESCFLSSYTTTTATCVCSISAVQTSSATLTFIKHFSTAAEIVATSFESRVISAGSLTPSDLTRNLIVTISTSAVMVLFLLGSVVFLYFDSRELDKMIKLAVGKTKAVGKDIDAILAEVVPVEFSELPWYTRFWRKLTEEHDWVYF